VEAEKHTARGRIAAAAEQNGWSPTLHTDLVWNVRIYTRAGRTILVGYSKAGAVTGATRMFGGVHGSPPKGRPVDDVTSRDRGKVDTVLAWLREGSRA
jgi:hypothetical protein